MQSGRIVAVDFGKKRVGLAVADPLRIFAQPEGTYSPDRAIARLQELSADPGIDTVVVGWPLTLAGKEGEATASVEEFARRLQKRMKGIRLVMWDERFTSEQAKQLLVESGLGRKARRDKGRIDAAAAAVILQEYLDDLRSE
ncbi:MAG: Holliday junction resolvase RuvX [Rhodothermales bacterium]